MSKTVDDLIGVYIEASNSVVWEAEKRGLCPMTLDMQRAGIAAVIRALRDEMQFGDWTAWHRLNEILGDAGNEKVAGGSAREDEKAVEAAGDKGPVTVNSPATDPAPVGVAKMQRTLLRKWRKTYDKRVKDMRATDPCPRCGYPAQDQCDSPDCNTSPPPMCEWVEQTHPRTGNWWKGCDGELRWVASREGRSCMVCKRPIKFTEAKT